ncbi:MAG TPA: DUF1330 domain-containing protein [Polyangiaceae bacterium]|nr:DUF1330 domain-containing protein [Polyangiaceae bacterium]
MTLVVILTVRRAALEAFRSFERQAAAVMARHGGAIERSVVLTPPEGAETLREVHIVTFPSAEAFAAYREDPALAPLAPLRTASVVNTEVWAGEDGPTYGPP